MPTIGKNHPDPANAPNQPARADFKRLTEQMELTLLRAVGDAALVEILCPGLTMSGVASAGRSARSNLVTI
jgi:hypothetical protein